MELSEKMIENVQKTRDFSISQIYIFPFASFLSRFSFVKCISEVVNKKYSFTHKERIGAKYARATVICIKYAEGDILLLQTQLEVVEELSDFQEMLGDQILC